MGLVIRMGVPGGRLGAWFSTSVVAGERLESMYLFNPEKLNDTAATHLAQESWKIQPLCIRVQSDK